MNTEDKFNVINSMFRDNPNFLVRHHIDSFDLFFKEKLKEIVKDNNPIRFITEYDEESKLYKYTADIYIGGKEADKIYYGKPIIYDNINNEERTHYMMPNEARLRNMTYSFPIHYDIDIDFKNDREFLVGIRDKFFTFNKTKLPFYKDGTYLK